MIEPLVKRCAGLDVHKAIVVCTVLIEEETGEIRKETREFSTFRCELEKLAQWLAGEGVELCTMESTGVYWKAVYENLEDAGLAIAVVNAYHIKNVPGRKTDVKDSEWLAELTRCGLLRASFIPPRDLRELRLMTRYRRKLNSHLASEKNRLHKILDDAGIRLGNVCSEINGASAKRMISALIENKKLPQDIINLAHGQLRKKKKDLLLALDGRLSDRHRYLLKVLQKNIVWLEQSIEDIDCQIVAAMEPYQEEWQLLQTIPGIDTIAAAIIISETGPDMQVFGTSKRFSKWVGVCPGNNESAGKKKSGRIQKGNSNLKRVLCEVANSAVKSNCQFKGYYKGLKIRRGHKRAIIAVAHKIIKIIFVILSRKEPYRDPEINYEEVVVTRNAPRWLRSLEKYGYIVTTNKKNAA